MALIFIGQSKCPICQQTLKEGDKITGFPAFISNYKDPLYFFNDNGFHEACVPKHAQGPLAVQLKNAFLEETDPQSRQCLVSGKPVPQFDKYFCTGLLTSDQESPLFQYNFLSFDRSHIAEWPSRPELLQALVELKEQGKWDDCLGGGILDDMIDVLSGN